MAQAMHNSGNRLLIRGGFARSCMNGHERAVDQQSGVQGSRTGMSQLTLLPNLAVLFA
jgi:hypothetical protein